MKELRRGLLASVCLAFFAMMISPSKGISNLLITRKAGTRATPMHQVQLTQQGYIQFLRWELPVPQIREFTFCLWVQSKNLTHPHSIFSYSKDEREKLIRAWISSHGRSIHLEIGGVAVFEAASNIREDRWYHICQSWENRQGRYALWINGRVKGQGHSWETVGHVVPRNGDIVLGQEYTDFDKGLEEGIEGSVLGFNLLLASSFERTVSKNHHRQSPEDIVPSHSTLNYASLPFDARLPVKIMGQNAQPDGIALVSLPVARTKRALLGKRSSIAQWESTKIRNGSRVERDLFKAWNDIEVLRELEDSPLGLQLVKLSYVRCEIGRGSPFIGGHLMLISWTRTPVRVFGGAIVKNAKSSCGNF